MTFGERVRISRIRKGLSQNDLSKIIGNTQTGISRIEKGETNPTFFTTCCIADALEISLDYLAEGYYDYLRKEESN